jgi:transcriptional regulator GlxA family with amidase domain
MDDRKRFAILVYDEVEPIDVGATYGVLSMARRILPQIEMFLVAAKPGLVRLANGLIVEAQHGYDDCPPSDVLVITGGPGWVAQCKDRQTINFIQKMGGDSLIASICTGGPIVAAAGLLYGKRATTRRRGVAGEQTPLQTLQLEHPDIEAVEALVVDNGMVITGGGVTLGIDTMLHVLERVFGRAAAEETARLMEYETAWEANSRALPTYGEQIGSV